MPSPVLAVSQRTIFASDMGGDLSCFLRTSIRYSVVRRLDCDVMHLELCHPVPVHTVEAATIDSPDENRI